MADITHLLNTAVQKYQFEYPVGWRSCDTMLWSARRVIDLDQIETFLQTLPVSSMEEEAASSQRIKEQIFLHAVSTTNYPGMALEATRGQAIRALLRPVIMNHRKESPAVAQLLLKNDKWVASSQMVSAAAKTGRTDIVAVLLDAGAGASLVEFNMIIKQGPNTRHTLWQRCAPTNLLVLRTHNKPSHPSCKNLTCSALNCNIAMIEMLVRAGGDPTIAPPIMCNVGDANLAKVISEDEMRFIALGMALHHRLGLSSSMRVLDTNIMQIICMAATRGFTRPSMIFD
jgi:hypothetical protein